MTTTVEEREQKYSRLPQDTIRKVYAVYDKVFGPSFQGYYQHVIKIANRSNINQQVFTEVETEVNEATQSLIFDIIKARGAFAEKK